MGGGLCTLRRCPGCTHGSPRPGRCPQSLVAGRPSAAPARGLGLTPAPGPRCRQTPCSRLLPGTRWQLIAHPASGIAAPAPSLTSSQRRAQPPGAPGEGRVAPGFCGAGASSRAATNPTHQRGRSMASGRPPWGSQWRGGTGLGAPSSGAHAATLGGGVHACTRACTRACLRAGGCMHACTSCGEARLRLQGCGGRVCKELMCSPHACLGRACAPCSGSRVRGCGRRCGCAPGLTGVPGGPWEPPGARPPWVFPGAPSAAGAGLERWGGWGGHPRQPARTRRPCLGGEGAPGGPQPYPASTRSHHSSGQPVTAGLHR